MKNTILKLSVLVVFFAALDQLSKFLAPKFWPTSFNEGMAFGIVIPRIVLIILTVALLLAVLYFFTRETNRGRIAMFSFAMILGGGLGNLIDRILKGSVIDFIDLKFWPIFNLADILIVAGVLTAIIFYKKIKVIR